MVEERVQKIIAQAGVCSRRKAEDLIQDGKVIVNNKIITIGDKADAEKDSIFVNGHEIEKEAKIYYMLNKPKNYITTSDDLYDRKKVIDLLPETPRVFAVGRLDRDATGLLLFTNDGDFGNKITHPSHEVGKTYVVKLDKPFDRKHVVDFEKGIYIDRKRIKSKVRVLDNLTIEIKVHVGLHKVVKRLFKYLGYYVKDLERTKIGNLKLDLPKGHYRLLTKKDIDLIFLKS